MSAAGVGAARGATRKRVAVIGAGPAGLATLKELREQGHDAVAFERGPAIGGVFAQHYRDLRLTSSSLITSFGAYSNGREHEPRIWSRDEYLAYLEAYATHFDLHPHIRLSTRVESARRDPATGTWRVRTAPLGASDPPPATRDGAATEHEFDHVAICSGMNTRPKALPAWPGLEQFTGTIVHSVDFVSAAPFAGKRVLVVGLGESGSDLTLLIARVAAASAVSTRKGPGYVIPRYVGGLPADLDTNRCYHAIPRELIKHPVVRFKTRIEDLFLGPDDDRSVLQKADALNRARARSPFHRFGTKSTDFIEAMLYHGTEYKPEVRALEPDGVRFVDGSFFACDVIVVCTGFAIGHPFLAEAHPDLEREAANPRALYHRMINPRLGLDLAWIGFVRPGIGSIPPCAEMQARLWALLLSGERRLPSEAEMQRTIEWHAAQDLAQFPDDARGLPALTDYLRFMEAVATEIGCNPSLWTLFLRDVRTWAKVLFGPITAAQYRLRGPGAEPERARAVLARVPMMPAPVLAYEFVVLLCSKLLHLLTDNPRFEPIGF